MENAIRVDWLNDEPEFGSAEAAVKAANRSDLRRDSARDFTATWRGTAITRIEWSTSAFEFELAGGPVVQLFPSVGRVDWSSKSTLPPGSSSHLPLGIRFPGLAEIHQWDRSAIAGIRTGRAFQMLFAGDDRVWLYAEGCPTLMFSRLICLDTMRVMLYWSDCE
jgi:hypothetical protein